MILCLFRFLFLQCALAGLLGTYCCHATVLVSGYATATNPSATFTQTVSAKVFDPATGSLYVGLSAADAANTISRADRQSGQFSRTQPKFTGIAPTDIAAGIQNIALVTFTGNNIRTPNIGAPLIAYTLTDSTTTMYAVKYDGKKTGATAAALKDANATEAAYTVGLAASCSYIFTGVAPSELVFGDDYSGIAVVCIKENSTTTLVLNQTAAEPSDSTIKAKRLDQSTPQLYINAATPPTIDDETAYLFWSDYFQRLYIGLNITTQTGAGGKAVIVGSVSNGALTFYNIADNAAIDPEGDVVATTTTEETVIKIKMLKTMHASTGPSYLITYGGGITNVPDALSRISALPLVDNTNDATHHGTLAKYDAALVDYKFVTPATATGDLAQFDDATVMVGAGPLPVLTTTASTSISDMEVIGDTVYVALSGVQSSTQDNGVFYSQAQFGADGKISHWTPWTKRAFPFRGFCSSSDCITQTPSYCDPTVECNSCCQNAGVAYVAVDAVNGKVWAVDGFSKTIVRLTAWDRGGCISQLPCQLNRALPCGCYSVLDLDQATRGFAPGSISGEARDVTEHRYALFGGCNKVVFARVSEAIATDNYITMTAPQTVMTNFCPVTNDCCTTSTTGENFLITKLDSTAGCIYSLEYSRSNSTEGTTNYFFAGTNNGLYVFANPDGTGFNVTELTTLDQPPFSTGTWFALDTLSETIVDIKVINPDLFVITRSIVQGKIVCNLYQIPLATDIDTMFNPLPAPIATSRSGDFSDVLLFTGLQPINNGVGDPQLLLSTNRGLFLISTAITRVPSNNTTMFAGIGGIDAPYPTTVWPFSVDAGQCNTYAGSSIYQMSGPTPTVFVPSFFNALCATNPFLTLYPITYFWSDGARRFFLVNRPCDCATQNRIMIYPYATDVWNIKIPVDQVLLLDTALDGVKRFNWIRHIGATGILMAGINDGVIALE